MKRLILPAVLAFLIGPPTIEAQVGTAFTYQGRLADAGIPASGIFDFEFQLFTLPDSGTGSATLTFGNVPVANGLFTVALDFGAAFTGSPRWLEIRVRPGASEGSYTALAPRQELTPAPNAMFSSSAGSVTGIIPIANGGTGSATQNFVDLSTTQTVGGDKTFSSGLVVTGTVSASVVTQGGNAVCDVSGNCGLGVDVVPIANGGTGSATQNFVNLTTAQTVGGDKTLTGNLVLGASTATTGNIMKGAKRFIHTFGSFNTFFGESAGNFATTGSANTATGLEALSGNTTGGTNTANGTQALRSNTSGGANTASGAFALLSNTTGGNNTASGLGALLSNTTGGANTASGSFALSSNSTGSSNTASGTNALFSNETGGTNTANGGAALFSNGTGSGNTASGESALFSNTTGNGNTASGTNALFSNETGDGNTAGGTRALEANTTGSSNTASGSRALLTNTEGSNNTALGTDADVASEALTNATAIGSGAIVNASNKVRLGNASVTVIEGQVAYTFPSDRNTKENLRPVDAQAVLEKLRALDVTTWNYIGHDPRAFRHYGPTAQDFFAAFGRDEVGAIGTDTRINSGDLAGVLMIGLKGLDQQMQKDRRTIATQEALLREQTRRIAELQRQATEIAALKRQVAEIATLKQLVSTMSELLKRLSVQSGMSRTSQRALQEP